RTRRGAPEAPLSFARLRAARAVAARRGVEGAVSSPSKRPRVRTLNPMSSRAPNGKTFRVDRGYVAVSGPDAEDFLERMLSNEVATLEVGAAKLALLLTPKGRIIAPLRA